MSHAEHQFHPISSDWDGRSGHNHVTLRADSRLDASDPAEGEISFPRVSLPCVCRDPVEPVDACVYVRVCVCVDRADGWAQGPADWGAAQTLSQMPPGRTGRSFVWRAGRAGPGTRSLNAMKHHTHACASRHPWFLVCAHTYSTVH